MSLFDRFRKPRRREDRGATYTDLRSLALSLRSDQAGVDAGDDRVYGVVLDWGLGDAVATFVSLADGTTSMYLSTGGGVIGGGEHESVAVRSRELVAVVQQRRDYFGPGPIDGPLADEEFRFIALTPAGPVVASGRGEVLAEGLDPLSPVFSQAQEVIGHLRMASGQ